MSCDKALTPSITIMMPVGYRTGTAKCSIRRIHDQAAFSMLALALPDIEGAKKFSPYSRWCERTRLFFVRESQVPTFADLETDLWRMVVYPDSVECISDIREWIRNYPVAKGTVVINTDADFKSFTSSPHTPWLGNWSSTELADISVTAQQVSRALLALVRHFDERSRTIGLLHAGVKVGTHVYHPSVSTGHCSPIEILQERPSHFKEALTFETSERAGFYPPHRSTAEGLYRAMTIQREYEKASYKGRRRVPVGLFDCYGFRYAMQPVHGLDAGKLADNKFLIDEFGYSMVMRRTYSDPNDSTQTLYGFNQQAAGHGRNRDKKAKAKAAAAGK